MSVPATLNWGLFGNPFDFGERGQPCRWCRARCCPIFFLNSLVYLVAIHFDRCRRIDTQLDLVTLDFDQGDLDIVTDYNFLIQFASSTSISGLRLRQARRESGGVPAIAGWSGWSAGQSGPDD